MKDLTEGGRRASRAHRTVHRRKDVERAGLVFNQALALASVTGLLRREFARKLAPMTPAVIAPVVA
jgi:hypothetical protein